LFSLLITKIELSLLLIFQDKYRILLFLRE